MKWTRTKIEAEGKKWSAHKGRTLFATHNLSVFEICIRFDLRAGKKLRKENNRYVEGKTSWDEGSGVENRLHQLPCSFPRTPCPYSVSHFSHNKGGNRSPGGLVSSSKIKSLPRNRLLASSYFADFDTRGICGRKEALTLNPELEAQMFPSCPAITAFLIMFVEISWSST